MKSKILVLMLLFLVPNLAKSDAHVCAPGGRCIFATDVYSGVGGDLFIPIVTPLSNRAAMFDNNNTLTNSTVTSTELSYLGGATSNIQAQINALNTGRTVNTITSGPYTVLTLARDYILNVNAVGAVSVTLPDATASNTFCADVKEISTGSINVGTQGGQTIDGFGSDSVTKPNQSNRYCAVNGNWFKY